MQGRDLLKLLDYSSDDILYLLALAKKFKELKHQGVPHRYLQGKNIALIFEKDSTRTRCAFEVAGYDLGMNVTYLGPTGSQLGKKESIADTARVLSRMYDGIEYRGFGQEIVETLAEYATVPVWNGLTDSYHPTQMLADVMTMEENFGRIKGLKLVFMGDVRNNIGNSLMVICAKLGINFVGCGPKDLWTDQAFVEQCREIANTQGSTIELSDNPATAVAGAHAIYTDVWLSMGEDPNLWSDRINLLKPYQVTMELMNQADPGAIFLHCLPAFHDLNTSIGRDVHAKFGLPELEVTNEVFESPKSKVFDEAENRLHTIKAVIYATMSDNRQEEVAL